MHVKWHKLSNITVRVPIHVSIHVTCMTNLNKKKQKKKKKKNNKKKKTKQNKQNKTKTTKTFEFDWKQILKVRNNCIFCKFTQGFGNCFKNTPRTKRLCLLLPLSASPYKAIPQPKYPFHLIGNKTRWTHDRIFRKRHSRRKSGHFGRLDVQSFRAIY